MQHSSDEHFFLENNRALTKYWVGKYVHLPQSVSTDCPGLWQVCYCGKFIMKQIIIWFEIFLISFYYGIFVSLQSFFHDDPDRLSFLLFGRVQSFSCFIRCNIHYCTVLCCTGISFKILDQFEESGNWNKVAINLRFYFLACPAFSALLNLSNKTN